ncbi:MAG: heparinase II/III family protein [Rhodospirillales bacterium]|nr:heparinase II/III family protein [Rhodospirillales bacterium]
MAITAPFRKIHNVLNDPVLQRWLFGRLTGRWRPAPFHRLHPEYLKGLELNAEASPNLDLMDLRDTAPQNPIRLDLAGHILNLEPGAERSFIERDFTDTESLLALHRFAWIPNAGGECDPAWVNSLWRSWMECHGDPSAEGWAWHPYTAAERLINILGFAKRFGLPGPREQSLETLAQHGPAIWRGLEYFGDINTGNHLANNGRGLFLGGLGLGIDEWAEMGGRILVREGDRIFAGSGILREGSSHYHLLVTRWYAECWLAASAAGRSETEALATITERALSVLPIFAMPGGFPLIGDVSPDCAPEHLAGLVAGERTGWLGGLEEEDFAALGTVRRQAVFDPTKISVDGWRRKQIGKWCAIWHLSPSGWAEQPGHAHQDFGGFELHFGNIPILRDFGRRSYGPAGEPDTGAAAHNALRIDGHDPYPPNKPYYVGEFRSSVCGAPPNITETTNSLSIETNAFSRLGNVGAWKRSWHFAEDGLSITDQIDGRGRHLVERHLHTTLPVILQDGKIEIGPIRILTDGKVVARPSARSNAYGQTEPATSTTLSAEVDLPWTGALKLEPLA